MRQSSQGCSMLDDRVIKESANALSLLDEFGPISITVFFTLIVLFLVGLFLKFILRDMGTVVKNNTEAMKDLGTNINRDFSDIKSKQNEIHIDVKEILHSSKCKYGINDFDINDIGRDKYEREDTNKEQR